MSDCVFRATYMYIPPSIGDRIIQYLSYLATDNIYDVVRSFL